MRLEREPAHRWLPLTSSQMLGRAREQEREIVARRAVEWWEKAGKLYPELRVEVESRV